MKGKGWSKEKQRDNVIDIFETFTRLLVPRHVILNVVTDKRTTIDVFNGTEIFFVNAYGNCSEWTSRPAALQFQSSHGAVL